MKGTRRGTKSNPFVVGEVVRLKGYRNPDGTDATVTVLEVDSPEHNWHGPRSYAPIMYRVRSDYFGGDEWIRCGLLEEIPKPPPIAGLPWGKVCG